jgi:hypothetical protein
LRKYNPVKSVATAFLFYLMLLGTSLVFAQQRSPSVLNEVVLEYPGLVDREALVELEFTVKSDGSVSDMKTVGGFYEPRFVEATEAAVRQLQFRPASESGEAVDWPGFRISGRFIVEDLFNTVNPDFSNTISAIENLIEDGDYSQAESRAIDLRSSNTIYFYEYAYVNLRLSEIYLMTNQLFDGYAASLKATQAYREGEHRNYGLESARMRDSFKVALLQSSQAISDDLFISNELDVNSALVLSNTITQPTQLVRPRHIRSSVRFSNWGEDGGDKGSLDVLNSMLSKNALQTGVQIFARLGHISPLLNDYDRFAQVEARVPEILETINGLANASVDQQAPLKSSHRIANGQWLFFPYRRTFAVTEVAGSLESVDFQCDRNVIRLDFQAETEWSIPESWENCSLLFRGEDGTTFSVIEFPAS